MVKKLVLMCLFVALGAVTMGAESCSEEIEKSEKSSKQATKNVNKVKLGMSKQQVKQILGKPQDTQVMQSAGSQSECWYYGTLAEKQHQLCFENGKLESKNRY